MERDRDGWTPEYVEARLLDALRWAKYNVGPAGPAGIRSGMPTFKPTLQDFAESGWGLPEIADPDDIPDDDRLYLQTTPEEVDRHTAALDWSRLYLARHHQQEAIALNLYLLCQVNGLPVRREIKRRNHVNMSAATFYRKKAKALTILSMTLAARGEPL